MNIDKKNGLIDGAEYIASPNFDDRPDEDDVSLLVIHNISLPPGKFATGDITRLFTNCLDCSIDPFYKEIEGLEVSSHLLIERDGSLIQYVPFHKRAWHAGKSSFDGRDRCNDFAIGIELEGTDSQAYEAVQYEVLFAIIKAVFISYPQITPERVVGHSDIAPGRKTDPGPSFDWALLQTTLNNIKE